MSKRINIKKFILEKMYVILCNMLRTVFKSLMLYVETTTIIKFQ